MRLVQKLTSNLDVWQLWANLDYPGMPSDPRKLNYLEPSTLGGGAKGPHTANTAFPKPVRLAIFETRAPNNAHNHTDTARRCRRVGESRFAVCSAPLTPL